MKSDQERWRRDFELTGQNPGSWQLLARSHLAGANVLFRRSKTVPSPEEKFTPHLRMMPVYLLLGYAMENLVKGLLVARGHNATWVNPFDDATPAVLDKSFKHHCLPDLFRAANVKTSPLESRLLEDLRDAIESEKYPVGVRPRSRKRTLGMDPDRDVQSAFDLFRRVEKSLRNICLDGVLPPCDPSNLGLAGPPSKNGPA